MPAKPKPFLLVECDLIRERFAAYDTTSQIVMRLNAMDCNEIRKRNNYQVLKFLHEMAIDRPRKNAAEIAKKGHQSRQRQSAEALAALRFTGDFKFKQAMLAARVAGENFVIGVVKDRRPLIGRMIHPEPCFSGCSSAAALCAEHGGKGIEFTEGV